MSQDPAGRHGWVSQSEVHCWEEHLGAHSLETGCPCWGSRARKEIVVGSGKEQKWKSKDEH